MIESGLITEIAEREKSPFEDVIQRYLKQGDKQIIRATRRGRPMLKKEIAVQTFCTESISRIRHLENQNG